MDVFLTVVIKSGIRQGGILSPALFNIHADVLLEALKESDLGCHMSYVSVLMCSRVQSIIIAGMAVTSFAVLLILRKLLIELIIGYYSVSL